MPPGLLHYWVACSGKVTTGYGSTTKAQDRIMVAMRCKMWIKLYDAIVDKPITTVQIKECMLCVYPVMVWVNAWIGKYVESCANKKNQWVMSCKARLIREIKPMQYQGNEMSSIQVTNGIWV